MKFEKFQLRSNSSFYAGAFELLRGRAPAHPRTLGGTVINIQK
jgi:hypothetical protein